MSDLEISKKKRWAFRIFSIFLGIIFAFVLLEIFLRSAAIIINTPVISPNQTETIDAPISFFILCVGDSHTYGKGAEDGFSYPAQLQRILELANPKVGWMVSNRGVPGFNSSQALAKVREQFASQDQIDLVLLCVGTNNDHNLTDATFLPQELIGKAPTLQWSYLFRNSRTFRLGQISLSRMKELTAGGKEVPDVIYGEIINEEERFLIDWIKSDIEKSNEIALGRGVKLVTVGYATNVHQAHVAMKELSEKGIPCIINLDFGLPVISARMDLYAPDLHPNDKGYAIIASRVARFLAKNNLAPVTLEQVETALEAYGF